MAEEAPGVQNKGMLIVALVLGALVVVIYNWQIEVVRRESRGETVLLAQAQRDIKPGEKIDFDKDIVLQEVTKQFQSSLGNVVVLKNKEDGIRLYKDTTFKRRVDSGRYLTLDDLQIERPEDPSDRIDVSRVAIAVPVREVVGDILRPGGRVNLVGKFNLRNEIKPFRIIESVKVLGIGGQGTKEGYQPGKGFVVSDAGQSNYRIITIEVKKEVSLQLETVLSYVPAGVKLEVENHLAPMPATAGEVNPELLRAIAGIAAPKPGTSTP